MKIPFIFNHFTQEPQPIIQFKEAVYSSNIKEIWGNDKSERIAPKNLILELIEEDYPNYLIKQRYKLKKAGD